jgi:hypothetical protein
MNNLIYCCHLEDGPAAMTSVDRPSECKLAPGLVYIAHEQQIHVYRLWYVLNTFSAQTPGAVCAYYQYVSTPVRLDRNAAEFPFVEM